MTVPALPPAGFADFLYGQGLARPEEPARWAALAGGVSADVWRVELPDRMLVVKRALPRLKVAERWEASIERSASEWGWLVEARRILGKAAPRPLAHDPSKGFLAMEYLPEPAYRNWKAELEDGHFEAPFARRVGQSLAQLHQSTANSPDLLRQFDTTDLFHQLRLSPYFFAVARKHPDVAGHIERLAIKVASTRRALVHGDVSPKNILVGPEAAPVFLDAECAWYGDPAFDLAFCLNHMLLDAISCRIPAGARLACFRALADAYFSSVGRGHEGDLEHRTTELVAVLMLARVDGKSPLSSLVRSERGDMVRAFSKQRILRPPEGLVALAEAWSAQLDDVDGSVPMIGISKSD